MLARYLVFSLLCLAMPIHASDSGREQAMADDITRHLTRGEPVWLGGTTGSFLSIFLDAERKDTRGGVIIVPDSNSHPDNRPVIQPLRIGLPLYRWATLAIQPPLWESGASLQDYTTLLPETRVRLQAAIAYLQDRNIQLIALLGYGWGCAGVLDFLQQSPEPAIQALVLIDASRVSQEVPNAINVETLTALKLPVLDIDRGLVDRQRRDFSLDRRQALKENPQFVQMRLLDPDSQYDDVDSMLVNRIHGWLTRVIPFKPKSPTADAKQPML